ncbi:MAG: hypothetical protein JNL61_00850 [Rhizobiaceae bacterium]|nr:hypothetical protein [Rhizobiaceae bacterium]
MLVVDRTMRTAVASSGASALLSGAKAGKDAGPASRLAGADSIFSPDRQDVTKQKVLLMDKIGKAFGFDSRDFKDMGAMADAVERELAKMSPQAAMALEQALGKKLGLDELGLSLRDMLDAMKEPGGEKDRKVDAALSRGLGAGDRAGGFGLDEIGRYGRL